MLLKSESLDFEVSYEFLGFNFADEIPIRWVDVAPQILICRLCCLNLILRLDYIFIYDTMMIFDESI
jgi:hypothetical protein